MKKMFFIILNCYSEKHDYFPNILPSKSCFKDADTEKEKKHVRFVEVKFMSDFSRNTSIDTPPKDILSPDFINTCPQNTSRDTSPKDFYL